MADAIVSAVVLVLVGMVGLLVMSVALSLKAGSIIVRKIADALHLGRSTGPAARPSPPVVCPNPRCGHVNARTAKFCARCGRPMRMTYDVDAYG